MTKKYEALVIFAKGVQDADLEGAVSRFVAEIAKFGAKTESTDLMGRMTFARAVDKRATGLYAKIRFDVEADQVAALRDRFDLYDEVYRLQIRARNLRIESAKAKDDERRKAYNEAKAAAAAAAAAPAETPAE